MKVTIGSFGRFHTMSSALQLKKHGLLERFIVNYPTAFFTGYGFEPKEIKALPFTSLLHQCYRMTRSRKLARFIHHVYSREMAKCIQETSDVFIGLSSF